MGKRIISGMRRIEWGDGRRAIVKQRPDAPIDFFAAEARGLAALREVGTLRVPDIFEIAENHIVLEDLGEGVRATDFWQRAGAGLARQHSITSTFFGFGHHGFCGDSPQDNTPDADGWRFFAERRLLPQTRRARDGGFVEYRDVQAIEHVCSDLRDRVPGMPAGLLHGDLWSGNLHVCGDGAPALIDAGAVHYGWAEADLAMLTLFGSPSPEFLDVYAAHAPLRSDWRERAPLYNLYHLLNHANLFGTSYTGALRDALSRCL